MEAIQAWFTSHYDVLHDFAGPIATIIAAGVAVFVTWRLGSNQLSVAHQQAAIAQQQADTAALQADLANVRLQHDLYDRRYKLYETAKSFLAEICREARAGLDSILTYSRNVGDALFLLDPDLVAYLEEIRKKAIRLRFLATAINLPQYAGSRSEMVDEEAQILTWFTDQFTILTEKFKRFLVLDKRNLARPN